MQIIRTCLLTFPLTLALGAAWACPDREAAVAAIQSGDTATAATLYSTIEFSPDCGDDFRAWLAERLAEASFGAALNQSDLALRQAFFEQSLGYFPHWRTHVELADIAVARGDRAAEAAALQAALNRIEEGPEHHAAEQAEIQALFERATVAVRLAQNVVAAPKTRNGDLGGIFTPNIRGFVVQEVPLPITFAYDSTDFTPEGEAYAQQLLDHLQVSAPPRVQLTGHTDPKGSETYNRDLSLRRAEALRDWLLGKGFQGEIVVDGRGEGEVPTPPAGISEGSEDHHRLARRVVLQRL